MINASEVVVPLSAIALAAGAIYRAGRLGGTVEGHSQRLDKIEDAVERSVSRTELDYRFQAIESKIDMVLRLLKAEQHDTG